MDTEDAGNAPKIEAIDVEFERLRTKIVGVALGFRQGSITVIAGAASDALTAGLVKPSLI